MLLMYLSAWQNQEEKLHILHKHVSANGDKAPLIPNVKMFSG
jgi:hypothetical protein